jgi:FkbM family methyltransferase
MYIVGANKTVTEIDATDDEIVNHFTDDKNCGRIIVNQINNDRIYDEFLSGKSDLTILDIGANIGLFTLYAKDCAKRIVSVEPTPSHQALFEKITKGCDNVELAKNALSDKDGDIEFRLCETNSTQNSIVKSDVVKNSETINVKGLCFSSLLKEYNLEHVDFCKIDIEGSEMVAITVDEMKAVYDKIDSMFIEVHSTLPDISTATIRWEDDLILNRKKLEAVLEEAGYKTRVLPGMYQDTLYVFKA